MLWADVWARSMHIYIACRLAFRILLVPTTSFAETSALWVSVTAVGAALTRTAEAAEHAGC